MRLDRVILKKDGLWTKEWDRDTKKNVTDRLNTDTHIFFTAWNTPLEIKGKVTLRDFLEYLKTLDPLILDMIGKMVGANFEEYFKEPLVSEKDPDRTSKLVAIEVYKYYEMSNHDLENWDFTDHAISAHGIGAKWDQGKGDSYAIEFTPWKYLLHLPLRMKEKTTITKTIYKKQKPKRWGFKKKGSKGFERGLSWMMDRKIDKWEHIDIKVTYTLGEFIDGLFDELCFFWTPATRDKNEKELMGRYEDCKTADPDDFSELVEE
jgi:hypothetical protein